jgi:uncharacterized metal-binding protein
MMSNGLAHARASVALAPAIALTVGWFIAPVSGLAAGIGCLAGVAVSPDLDLEGVTYSERVVVMKLGRIGWLWAVLWWPYAKLVPHRSPVSHAPLIGTALRLAYLAVPAVLVLAVAGVRLSVCPTLLWVGVGLAASDLAHCLMDGWRC